MRKLLLLSTLALLCSLPSYGQTTAGWGWVQDILATANGACVATASSCTITVAATTPGSVWVVQAGTQNNVQISSVTGGGGTWVTSPSFPSGTCAVFNATGGASDCAYNLGGTSGTTSITVNLSAAASGFFGLNFFEVLPPSGSTASFDTAGTANTTSCSTCTAVALTTTATDACVQFNDNGGSTVGWNSFSAPWTLDTNSNPYYLNTTKGSLAAPTFTQSPASSSIFNAICFKSTMGTFTLAQPVFSLVNVTYANLAGLPCTPSCGAITIPATTAGNLLFVVAATETGPKISSITDGGDSFLNCTTANITITSTTNAQSCSYSLSVAGGRTSITPVMSANATTGIAIYEVHSTSGVFSLEAQGSTQRAASAPYFNGQSFTLAGTNDVCFQGFFNPGGAIVATLYPQAFVPGFDTEYLQDEVSEVVLVNTLSSPAASGVAPVWTTNQNFASSVNGACFKSPQIITAASCSSAAVQAALNSVVSDGTTVVIPSCSLTQWTSTVTYTQGHSITLQGSTTTSGTCAPGGSCSFSDGTTIGGIGTGSATLSITTTAGKSLRITGITWNIPSAANAAFGDIDIQGGGTSFRFDHNHVFDQCGCTNSGDHFLQVDGNYGVVDHNYFDAPPGSGGPNQIGTNLFFLQPTNLGSDGTGNGVWAQADGFGGSGFLFIENNLFQNGNFLFDDDYGGRAVVRYNIVGPTTRIQTHGVGSAPPRRSGRAVELYNNTFTFVASPTANNSFSFLVDLEGGTGLEWGNTVSGFYSFISGDVVRTNASTYNQSAVPNGFGYCSPSPINGVAGPSPWDFSGTGPCLDNIGRGKGDLVSCTGFSSFPCNNTTTGTPTWTHEALVPHYSWLNTFSPVPNTTPHYWSADNVTTVNNRDYYFDCNTSLNTSCTGAFTGAAGTGNGLLSARPSTCTVAVGYWATDTQTLYTCNTPNTWTAYYTPYTYPHPLVSGVVSSTPGQVSVIFVQ